MGIAEIRGLVVKALEDMRHSDISAVDPIESDPGAIGLEIAGELYFIEIKPA